MKKYLSIIIAIVMMFQIVQSEIIVFAEEENNNYYVQYSGSTNASWGYKPYCTFTINKIVGNRFRGTVSAQNMDSFLSI